MNLFEIQLFLRYIHFILFQSIVLFMSHFCKRRYDFYEQSFAPYVIVQKEVADSEDAPALLELDLRTFRNFFLEKLGIINAVVFNVLLCIYPPLKQLKVEVEAHVVTSIFEFINFYVPHFSKKPIL